MANKAVSSGVNLTGLLGVVFVVLKLTGTISWSWWWVTLPFWGGTVLAVAIIVIMLIILGVADLIRKSEDG